MHSIFQDIVFNAYEKSGWIRGDLLKKFHFMNPLPLDRGYPELFSELVEVAKQEPSRIEKRGGCMKIYMHSHMFMPFHSSVYLNQRIHG